jgi:hypothetical protein
MSFVHRSNAQGIGERADADDEMRRADVEYQREGVTSG